MAIRVVTDTAASLGEKDSAQHLIATVPIHVSADGVELSERELEHPGFPGRLEDMKTLPRTSQPSPEEFARRFREITAEGDDVLAVLISAGMSGTIQSAEIAAMQIRAERPNRRIEIVDSRSNSREEAYVVLAAARAASDGATMDECIAAAKETIRRTRLLFTPHTLEYLRRGGRISGAAGLLGIMLRIVPVLTADKGATGIAGVTRGVTAAWRKIVTLMRADVERLGLSQATVQYFADEGGARRFATEVIEPLLGVEVPLIPIHPVVGIHVGPAVGIAYETERPLR